MSSEQELPRGGSVWCKGDEWRIVPQVGGGWVFYHSNKIAPGDRVRLKQNVRPDAWLAWASDAECVYEGE